MHSADSVCACKEWKLVDIKRTNGIIRHNHLLLQEMEKEDFIMVCDDEFHHIKEHLKRVTGQIEAIQNLKDYLVSRSAIIKMDYSENFHCHYQDEPSALYYDSCQVTVHLMVVWFGCWVALRPS